MDGPGRTWTTGTYDATMRDVGLEMTAAAPPLPAPPSSPGAVSSAKNSNFLAVVFLVSAKPLGPFHLAYLSFLAPTPEIRCHVDTALFLSSSNDTMKYFTIEWNYFFFLYFLLTCCISEHQQILKPTNRFDVPEAHV
ncbi:hypothetical protein RUM43_002421 [Polyplax serrata]|uniref:Uncharacterized protein n=1 Tax=Polyplax serrata TaxID=468196 RepID=A0AAN8NZ65_POLSC